MNHLQTRVQRAHREAFALITAAINNPTGVDLETDMLAHANDTEDPVQSVLDLAQVLVWHAAGAILTHTGDPDDARSLIQAAALQQEARFQEDTDE